MNNPTTESRPVTLTTTESNPSITTMNTVSTATPEPAGTPIPGIRPNKTSPIVTVQTTPIPLSTKDKIPQADVPVPIPNTQMSASADIPDGFVKSIPGIVLLGLLGVLVVIGIILFKKYKTPVERASKVEKVDSLQQFRVEEGKLLKISQIPSLYTVESCDWGQFCTDLKKVSISTAESSDWSRVIAESKKESSLWS